MLSSIMAITFGVFALILLLMTVKTVTQGTEYTVERFGKFMRVLSRGFI
jgi:regulator of protease activity HflC (stomatin/prohibitin superfamily)